jgi:hypothetical protein
LEYYLMGSLQLQGSTSGSVTLIVPAVAGSSVLTLPAVTDTLVSLAATQTLTNKTLTSPTITGAALSAGTATVAPVNLATGTNLTTATAGAIEYDGKVIYGTPQGTQRGIIPGAQFYRLDANYVGSNATGAQSLFGVGVTLSASTVYNFEINFVLAKTAGATSHTVSISFAGTATVNNILWQGLGMVASGPMPSTQIITGTANVVATNSTAAIAIAPATTTPSVIEFITIKGTVSINAGGTFIPQYTLSAAPGGAYSTVVGSYMNIYPIGASGSNVNVGTWA